MSYIAASVIIAGGAATAGGLGFAGAQSQASAAKEGGANLLLATQNATFLQQSGLDQVRRLLGPFVQLGQGAAGTLGALTVSPQEQQRQYDSQRLQLQSEIERLSRPLGFNDVPQVFGKNGSERWAAAVNAANAVRERDLANAQNSLNTLNKQAELSKQQATERQGEGIQASPLYQFQEQLGSRNINRELAARGLYNSGAGLETIRQFQAQLGAEETDRQFNRLFGLLGVGANAAQAQAGAITGTSQSIGNQQIAGTQGVGQLNQQAAAANAAGLGAIGSSITGGINSGLQLSLYNNLFSQLAGTNTTPATSLYAQPSTIGPQLNTGVQPYVPQSFSLTGAP